MKPRYYIMALIVCAGAVAWTMLISAEASSTSAAIVKEEKGAQSVAGRPMPFLAAHEQNLAFEPSAENIAPSFHVETEALRQQLEANPQDTTALLRMARLKQDGHREEEAVQYYRRYLALQPERRAAWLDLIQVYGALQRWDDAREAVAQMLDRFPDDPAALYNLGAIHANTGRFEEARATWQRVARQGADPAMQAMASQALGRLDTMRP